MDRAWFARHANSQSADSARRIAPALYPKVCSTSRMMPCFLGVSLFVTTQQWELGICFGFVWVPDACSSWSLSAKYFRLRPAMFNTILKRSPSRICTHCRRERNFSTTCLWDRNTGESRNCEISFSSFAVPLEAAAVCDELGELLTLHYIRLLAEGSQTPFLLFEQPSLASMSIGRRRFRAGGLQVPERPATILPVVLL